MPSWGSGETCFFTSPRRSFKALQMETPKTPQPKSPEHRYEEDASSGDPLARLPLYRGRAARASAKHQVRSSVSAKTPKPKPRTENLSKGGRGTLSHRDGFKAHFWQSLGCSTYLPACLPTYLLPYLHTHCSLFLHIYMKTPTYIYIYTCTHIWDGEYAWKYVHGQTGLHRNRQTRRQSSS